MAAGAIDLDRPGKYPIVLSDELLGKTNKEVFTGIRYNHKPDASSTSSSASLLKIQPSNAESTTYNVSLTDNSEKYAYQGERASGEGQYVLIFDAVNKRFVLHRVDSTFDMNLVGAPWSQNAKELRSQYPQLETETKSQASATQAPPSAPTSAPKKRASKATKKAPAARSEKLRRSTEKPKKSKPPPREPTPEEEDSDDVLTIEYPDAPNSQSQAQQRHQYHPAPIFQQHITHEAASDEDEDAEGEDEEEEYNRDVDHLKLPSPATNNHAGGMSDEELELDLEAELEQALQDTGANAAESDESEEE